MRPKNRQPIHPGVFLREIILPSTGLSQSDVAHRIKVSRNTISLLCHGKLRLSVENAAKLSRLLNVDAGTLMRMQNAYDLWEAMHHSENFAWIKPIAVTA